MALSVKELMVWDWCRDGHGFPMRITNVGEDYAYATFEGLEGDPWGFDDKDCKPSPIEITPELLKANGWEEQIYSLPYHFTEQYENIEVNGNYLEWEREVIYIWFAYDKDKDNDGVQADILVPCKYVHQLQQVLRLAGMTELANNFKV